MKRTTLLLALLLATAGAARAAAVKVVTTLPTYASIAREVGGDRVTAQAISQPDEDAHFVKPKPSLALMLRDADLFVTTGLDLELWGPALVDKSGNTRIRDGQPGYVSASQGVPLLEVPASASRAGGDIHVYGNPHIDTSPLNAKIIARNIAAGLKRVDPAGAATYEQNLRRFTTRLDEALYGKELPTLLGAATLDPLLRQGKLIDFLRGKQYQGKPLLDRLGGWLRKGLAFRGQKLIAYHRSLPYFAETFGVVVAGYMEPKPGIPPSARHVKELLDLMQRDRIQVIVEHTYTDSRPVNELASRTGATAVELPLEVGGQGSRDFFALVDLWVDGLSRAFQETRR